MKFKNHGFSLVEMMVVAGIGSVLAVAMGQLMVTQFNALAAVKFKSEAGNTVVLAKMALLSEVTCQANLTSGNFGATPTIPYPTPADFSLNMSKIDFDGGAVAVPVSATPPTPSAIWVGKIMVKDFQLIGLSGLYVAQVELTVQTSANVLGGSATRQSFPLQFKVDDSGVITSCSAGELEPSPTQLAKTLDEVCIYLGGTPNGGSCTMPDTPTGGAGVVNQTAACSTGAASGSASRSIVDGTPMNQRSVARLGLQTGTGSFSANSGIPVGGRSTPTGIGVAVTRQTDTGITVSLHVISIAGVSLVTAAPMAAAMPAVSSCSAAWSPPTP